MKYINSTCYLVQPRYSNFSPVTVTVKCFYYPTIVYLSKDLKISAENFFFFKEQSKMCVY